jgi:hypothetical protein
MTNEVITLTKIATHRIRSVIYRSPGNAGDTACMNIENGADIYNAIASINKRLQGVYDELAEANKENKQHRSDMAAVRRVFNA